MIAVPGHSATTRRPAAPAERCPCGSPALWVFEGTVVGDLLWCGKVDA